MHLLLVGISHRTAPVELRERLDFQARGVDRRAARAGRARLGARSGRACRPATAPSSTSPATTSTATRQDLVRLRQRVPRHRSAGDIAPHVYDVDRSRRRAPSVPRRRRPRLAGRRRAADSRPGEGRAHRRDRRPDRPARCSTACFTRSFAVGKRVRTETGLGSGAVSVSYAAVALARKIFGDLERPQRRRDRRRRDGQADRACT